MARLECEGFLFEWKSAPDGEWRTAQIAITLRGLQARLDVGVEAAEVEGFRVALKRLVDEFPAAGYAAFANLEEDFELRIERDGLGRLDVAVQFAFRGGTPWNCNAHARTDEESLRTFASTFH